MHQHDQDSSWTTKDSYDDVPAFKELFERLESDDRDFLAPHPTATDALGPYRPEALQDRDSRPNVFRLFKQLSGTSEVGTCPV
jgi:hypothetical protein